MEHDVALNRAALQSKLRALFTTPPATSGECARAWADAMQTHFAAVTPPSSAVGTASTALAIALSAAFQSSSGAAALMEQAFAAFAVTVGAGMAPFIPTPPPAPVGFAAQLSATQGTTEGAATAWTNLIDTWARTGTATSPPPASVVTLWS